MARLRIGTSGWTYKEWKDAFYRDVRAADWLAYYARTFDAVEINASFYRAQRADALARWASTTPQGFCFTAKGHRATTHMKRLKGAPDDVARQRAIFEPLGRRLEVVVWQLPRRFPVHLERLDAFGDALRAWPEVRHAVELRHPSWHVPEVAQILERHGLANVLSDAPTFPLWDAVTSDLVYVRLHGHEEIYVSAYDDLALDRWAERCRGWLAEGRSVHVYFDNDAKGAAPADALHLKQRLEGA